LKFQPIFDGYVTANAPHLLLSPKDSLKLLYIGKHLGTINHPKTNPPGFWKNLAHLANGKKLSPSSCARLEPLQYWADIITSGIEPSKVKLLGINGGKIAAAEALYVALAKRKRVGDEC
jgi:hypothetical protein